MGRLTKLMMWWSLLALGAGSVIALTGSVSAAANGEMQRDSQESGKPGRDAGKASQGSRESSKAGRDSRDRTHVFVNGALAVPGAPANTDTVPSKYSARNAASDRLPIVAFRLNSLTADQRREIYEQLTGTRQPLALSPGQDEDPHATVGSEIPTDLALHNFTPMPQAVAAKIPELRDTVYIRSGGRVLLIAPENRIVIGVLPEP